MVKIALNCAVVLEISNITPSDVFLNHPWMTGMWMFFNTLSAWGNLSGNQDCATINYCIESQKYCIDSSIFFRKKPTVVSTDLQSSQWLTPPIKKFQSPHPIFWHLICLLLHITLWEFHHHKQIYDKVGTHITIISLAPSISISNVTHKQNYVFLADLSHSLNSPQCNP